MDCTHTHTFVLILNNLNGLFTLSHNCTEFVQYIWTVHTVTSLYWFCTVYMDCTHRYKFVLSLSSLYGLYTLSLQCTEFEQLIWTVHTPKNLYWVWTFYMDCTNSHTLVLSLNSVNELYSYTPPHICTAFEPFIWTVHTVTQLNWVWTVWTDFTHRHTFVLLLNSLYGLYTLSHRYTEFEKYICTVHTVTPLYWIWTLYMGSTRRHTILLSYSVWTVYNTIWSVNTVTPLYAYMFLSALLVRFLIQFGIGWWNVSLGWMSLYTFIVLNFWDRCRLFLMHYRHARTCVFLCVFCIYCDT
jgi:hypothetical protein